jgi:hypothetical protein
LFLFAYLSCSCHNMNLVFYQIGLSSVYHPYNTTDWLKHTKKEINCHKLTYNKAHLLIEMHSRWLPHDDGWENAKSVQAVIKAKGGYFTESKIYLDLVKMFGLLPESICYFIYYIVFTIMYKRLTVLCVIYFFKTGFYFHNNYFY